MEAVINKIREILRKEGITGMDSINHCIIFIIARILLSDEEKCKKFGIDEKNSYYNVLHDEDGDHIADQDLFGRIFTKGDTTCLVGQIANKLKFSNIKFKLESPQHVKQIMKELEKIDVNKLDTKFDIIGTIYELHLKSGTSNAMRDLGQYYTNRQVINYMIKLCDPKMDKKGNIETIIDPTMGTGGFLTMSIKYLNEKYKNKVDWSKNKKNLYGFDIDENVRSMALLNILLECGEFCDDTIIKNDTLYNDFKLKDNQILEKVDIILANEPMGIKNIIHANCCDRIKELKMRGTKAEPLFLQLFMQSLKENGKCAVIVPDGVLFNDSNLHNDTRKHLVENFNLKKIVSLNDDFFLNTGVKTSILYFVNDGKTKEVEFSELKLNKDELIENSIIKVSYDKIKELHYTLFVNKYNAKEIEKIEGVVYKKLGDICKFKNGKQISKENYIDGKYPVIGGGCQPAGFHNEYNRIENMILCSSSGANAGYISKYSCKIWASDCFSIEPEESVNNTYLYYYLKLIQEDIYKLQSGSAQPHIYSKNIDNLEIPIPSISVQKKIVEQLDIFSQNIQTSKQQIEESKKILKYYVQTMTLWDESKKMCDICEFKNGKGIKKDNLITGEYPVIGGGQKPMGFHNEYNTEENTILCSSSGAYAGFISKYNKKVWASDCFSIKPKDKKINNNYLYHAIKIFQDDIYKIQTGSAQPHIYSKNLEHIIIKIPSLEKQKEIVTYCDNIEETIKSMEKRINNNEDLMKLTIETYLKNNNKDSNSDSESSSSESESEEETKKKVEKKPVKKTTNKKKVESSSLSESESEESEEEKPKKKLSKMVTKTPTKKK
jgi:type I restriction-modification system DNA methylase subunit